MKKFNRLIALVVLMGICFPMISPIRNVVYAVEYAQKEELTEKESEDIMEQINGIIERLDKLEKETEGLSKKN